MKEVFGDEPFLYLVNKDAGEVARAWFLDLNGEALPHTPHGLNGFAHHHNLAAIASFLPPPFHHRFLATQNLTAEAVCDAVHHQAVYQAVCRCSLRDPESTSAVKVLLTDRHVAEWLADQFPGCRLGPVGDVPLMRRGRPGREPRHADAKARVEAHRQRQRDLAEEVMLAQMIPDIQDGTISLKRYVKKDLYSDIVTAKDDHFFPLGPGERWFADLSFLREELWVGTLFRHRRDVDTSCHATMSSPDLVVDWLRHLHGLSYADKHDNWLISPALFNPTLGETARGKDNVVLAWGIWLDVDGGDLPYPQFQRMFPGTRMVIYNTWSSTDLTRYRVFLPTTGYMLGDTYEAVCGQIVHVVQSNRFCSPRQKQRGSSKPCHGIDLGKTYAANMMYLPCQPGPGGRAFFEVFDGDPLDPALWLVHNVEPIPGPARTPVPESLLLAETARADVGAIAPARKLMQSAAARITGDGQGHRNNNLYYAARTCFALADVGLLDAFEVETSLSSAARLAGLDAAEIKATMASARRSAWNNSSLRKSDLEPLARRQQISEDDQQATHRKGQKPVWVENFIKRLQAQGFVQWDSCTWIHPKDIPLYVVKCKIKRFRRRRREFEQQQRAIRRLTEDS